MDSFELWCWRRLLRVPWTAQGIKLVHPKGNQSWIFIGRIFPEAETPILWSPDAKNWVIGEDPDAGKDWRQEERWQQRMRWLDGISDSMDMRLSKLWELGDGQGTLVCCSPRGCKESDMTEWLNWTEFTQGKKQGEHMELHDEKTSFCLLPTTFLAPVFDTI